MSENVKIAFEGFPLQETKFGFQWGPAEVIRVCDDQKGVTLMIAGARQEIEIRVTPSGLIRSSEPRKTKK